MRIATHLLKAGQRPFVERSGDGENVLPVDFLRNSQWNRAEVELYQSQQPQGIHLDDDCRDFAIEAPLDDPGQERVRNRAEGSAPFAMSGLDAVACPFPDPVPNRPFAF